MKFAWLCKRQYTHKDLLADRFGRLYHLPVQLGKMENKGIVVAGDYVGSVTENLPVENVDFISFPLTFLHLPLFIRQTYRRFKEFKPDILIAGADSYLGFIGLLVARKLRVPFVFDVFDDYASFTSDKIPGMRGIYHYTLKNADLVVSVSNELLERYSHLVKKGAVIGNGTDINVFRPIEKEKARLRFSLAKKDVVVGYFGSMNPDRGIEILIDAIEILRKDYPHITLLLAGKNSLNLEFSAPFVNYQGMLPQGEIPYCINACDVVVVPYLPNKQDSVGNACKIAEYLACGVPVVATKVSDHEIIFKQNSEILCDPGDTVSLSDAIRRQVVNQKRVPLPKEMLWEDLAGKLEEFMGETLCRM